MNTDQFGMSDLNTAYQLGSKLDARVNYFIWEDEPDIESILYFMNKMDVVLSMRLHGCIFAMTHNVSRLIGIDYQIGREGKVSQLMQESGLGENCLSVKSLKCDSIVEKINTVLERRITAVDIVIVIPQLIYQLRLSSILWAHLSKHLLSWG